MKSEETQNMLRAVVQVLALKASPPMRMEGSREVLEQLDHILECENRHLYSSLKFRKLYHK